MRRVLPASACFVSALIVMLASSWAAPVPIGALTIKGEATITAQDAVFTLQDQDYAYFAGDRIRISEGGRAMMTTTDGLKVTFLQTSDVRITKRGGVYRIDLQQGGMVVDVRQGTEYELTHDGETVPVADKYMASSEPYVAVVSPGTADIQFYMPAQITDPARNPDEETERRGFLWWLFGGAVIGGIGFAIDGDGGPPPPGQLPPGPPPPGQRPPPAHPPGPPVIPPDDDDGPSS